MTFVARVRYCIDVNLPSHRTVVPSQYGGVGQTETKRFCLVVRHRIILSCGPVGNHAVTGSFLSCWMQQSAAFLKRWWAVYSDFSSDNTYVNTVWSCLVLADASVAVFGHSTQVRRLRSFALWADVVLPVPSCSRSRSILSAGYIPRCVQPWLINHGHCTGDIR